MNTVQTPLSRALRVLAIAALLATGAVWADEYDDVNRLLRAGQTGEALSKADQYLAGKPRDPQMRFLRGVILSESGKQTEAINTFVKLTEDFPELPEPYNNLAVLYAGQSQFDKARIALEMAIRTNPSYATAHENLGDVYAKLASQAYSKALQLDSSNTAVQPKLALIRDLFTPGKSPRPAPAAIVNKPAPTPIATPVAPAVATPVALPVAAAAAAPSPAPAPAAAATPAAPGAADKAVEASIAAWAAAWSARDMDKYLAAYASNFTPPNKQSRSAWESERRARITGKSSITVKVTGLRVTVNGNTASASFIQSYSGDALSITSRKTLDFANVNGNWLITRESSSN